MSKSFVYLQMHFVFFPSRQILIRHIQKYKTQNQECLFFKGHSGAKIFIFSLAVLSFLRLVRRGNRIHQVYIYRLLYRPSAQQAFPVFS